MKTFKIVILLFLFISCKSEEEIKEGELHFKLVQPIPSDGFNNIQIKEIEKAIQEDENVKLDYFRTLKNNNLLGLPNINLKIDNDILHVFLKKSEYEKVKKYSLQELNQKRKKIILKIYIKKIDCEIYYSDKIIEVLEIDGNTSSSK